MSEQRASDRVAGATDADPHTFVDSVPHPTRRADGRALLELMRDATGEEPRMWGPTIVGFGEKSYRTADGKEHRTMRIGFSPRKASLSLYGLGGGEEGAALLARLGKHKKGASCVYVTKLADVDVEVLRALVAHGWARSGA